MKKYVVASNGFEIKRAPIGFSWTTFFFSFFPAIFRNDWKWAGIMFVAYLFLYGLVGIIMSFLYNKLYLKDLLNKGYKITEYVNCTEQEVKCITGLVTLGA